MNWTKEPPQVPGYYWKGNHEGRWEVVWVEELDGEIMFQRIGMNNWLSVSNSLIPSRQWQGPIEPQGPLPVPEVLEEK